MDSTIGSMTPRDVNAVIFGIYDKSNLKTLGKSIKVSYIAVDLDLPRGKRYIKSEAFSYIRNGMSWSKDTIVLYNILNLNNAFRMIGWIRALRVKGAVVICVMSPVNESLISCIEEAADIFVFTCSTVIKEDHIYMKLQVI